MSFLFVFNTVVSMYHQCQVTKFKMLEIWILHSETGPKPHICFIKMHLQFWITSSRKGLGNPGGQLFHESEKGLLQPGKPTGCWDATRRISLAEIKKSLSHSALCLPHPTWNTVFRCGPHCTKRYVDRQERAQIMCPEVFKGPGRLTHEETLRELSSALRRKGLGETSSPCSRV